VIINNKTSLWCWRTSERWRRETTLQARLVEGYELFVETGTIERESAGTRWRDRI